MHRWELSAAAHREAAESDDPTTTSVGHLRAEAESIVLSTTSDAPAEGPLDAGFRQAPRPEQQTPRAERAGGFRSATDEQRQGRAE